MRMQPSDPGAPRVSVGIPLFRSRRFLDVIAANIDAMPREGIEVLVSDRHGDDDALEALERRFRGDRRLRFFRAGDRLDWVHNVNFLLSEARGEYWRLLPHDDTSPAGSLEALVSALDAQPDALLAFGPTLALDLEGARLPDKDQPSPMPAAARDAWTLELALEMHWKKHFLGAFKGLVRRRVLAEEGLLVRGTPGQVFAERCWLFGLCLLGRFVFVEDAPYFKRLYAASTHRQWAISGRSHRAAARCMIGYLWDLVADRRARLYGAGDLWLNARRRASWQDARGDRRSLPTYRPLGDPRPLLERGLVPRTRLTEAWVAAGQRAVRRIRQTPLPSRPRSQGARA